jgi:hypothetical protein
VPRKFLVVTLLLGASACQLDLGRGEVTPFRYDALAPAAADVKIMRDVELISAERSQHYLDKYGPDKIGAITSVDVTLDEAYVDGVPAGMFAEPQVRLDGLVFQRIGDTEALDDDQVNGLRARLLEGAAVVAPMEIYAHAVDPTALAQAPPSLHIVVVVQPTLHVDATKSF